MFTKLLVADFIQNRLNFLKRKLIHIQIQFQYRAQDLFNINNDDDDEVDYNYDDLAVHVNSSSSSTTAPPKAPSTITAYRTPKTFELLLSASNMSQAQTRRHRRLSIVLRLWSPRTPSWAR